MFKFILSVITLSVCILGWPISAIAEYPPDCETHILMPTEDKPQVIDFSITQEDMQGIPPSQGSFITAVVSLINQLPNHPKRVQSEMIMDNYWGAQGAAHNSSIDQLGDQAKFWFYEDHIQTKNNAHLHFILTKIGDKTLPQPIVSVLVCGLHH